MFPNKLLLCGSAKYHGLYLEILRNITRNITFFINVSPTIITESLLAIVPLFVRSAWGFSPLFLILLVFFICSGFFPLDLSRPICFWLSHLVLLRFACLSLGSTTCFDFSLIRIDLCSRTTSNNFVYLSNFL